MDRGVIVGGGLIAASFLVAILLNRSANEEAAPVEARKPAAHVCEDPVPRPPGVAPISGTVDADCEPAPPPEPLAH